MEASTAGMMGRRPQTAASRPRGEETARTPRGCQAVAAPAHSRRPRRFGARFEHALFAVTLGTVGYIWLGALLAEAAQGV